MKLTIKEISTELNAVEVYSLFEKYKNTILLDSSKEDEKLSKYSFIGINPFAIFKSIENRVEIEKQVIKDADPFYELERILKEYEIKEIEFIEREHLKNINLTGEDTKLENIPFVGGCIGYFSYDIGWNIEELPNTAKKDFQIPESYFVFYDNIIIFDLLNNKQYITALGKLKHREESIRDIQDIIGKGCRIVEETFKESNNKFYSNFTESEYIEAVARMKEYIKNGDVYIANLTQRMWCYNNESSFEIYKRLRTINKAPFAAFLNLDGFEVISSSPERFIQIKQGKVETRPIKGTRPRGATVEEDKRNKEELLSSEKDKAELLMIVDLERNDLSKVCKPHTVKVKELFALEEYATVFHLVSTVEGELKKDCSTVKCMRECFPGGSITGAPKIRAMEIIEELERVKRNIYTGSIGYFDFRGNADFNIVIRTIVKKDGKAYFGIGGGVTIESDEKMEYDETLDKARALMRVL
ncbi:aminodeoxychorismate/anthranilate synthase component I [Clostridium polyendosporum]|uniref:Anthranilate synthase component 1 n=1 Tax=Clostridium polyendosporum TaxID=69208 RepID=A0A919S0F9_9CLOT|nr:aminodeoxychorismate synthase component I [Clostridium polyendosporum]GIM29589.1 aminodeoxychorismate/anthranilate synthase component I [Clostridium polyendosporum]